MGRDTQQRGTRTTREHLLACKGGVPYRGQGHDGLVRAAVVCVASESGTTTLKRPVPLLYPLGMNDLSTWKQKMLKRWLLSELQIDLGGKQQRWLN